MPFKPMDDSVNRKRVIIDVYGAHGNYLELQRLAKADLEYPERAKSLLMMLKDKYKQFGNLVFVLDGKASQAKRATKLKRMATKLKQKTKKVYYF